MPFLWPTRYLIFSMEVLYLANLFMFCDLLTMPGTFIQFHVIVKSNDHAGELARYKNVLLGMTSLWPNTFNSSFE